MVDDEDGDGRFRIRCRPFEKIRDAITILMLVAAGVLYLMYS